MLSLIYSKPALTAPAAARAPERDDTLPKIVDFNTIEQAAGNGGADADAGTAKRGADTDNHSPDGGDGCADEDFIDIQLRQLSYAEVAALNLAASEAQSSQKASSRPSALAAAAAAAGADAVIGENILVIDQVEALGKSITDLEMLDSFKKYEKFNSDPAPPCADGISPEDQWDLYVEGKTPKKIIRKKKNHKQKKPAHN
ncbi:hypothetical protein PMKS-000094 [Pichia membranifaciens]|uniref:Uncharacterized protein n=1 Tax=Pichia membranifaciens TaxID=4926 RepID=A0A1Q2YAT2_9ASCO|nr:hypothetical protein PMKS-000094 [Pichia membranifaciens]